VRQKGRRRENVDEKRAVMQQGRPGGKVTKGRAVRPVRRGLLTLTRRLRRRVTL